LRVSAWQVMTFAHRAAGVRGGFFFWGGGKFFLPGAPPKNPGAGGRQLYGAGKVCLISVRKLGPQPIRVAALANNGGAINRRRFVRGRIWGSKTYADLKGQTRFYIRWRTALREQRSLSGLWRPDMGRCGAV